MPYTDPSFEARRKALQSGSGSPAQQSGGFSSGGLYFDQGFEQRRKQIYTTPAPSIAPPLVSSTPTPAPAKPNFLQQAGQSIGNFGTSVLNGLGDFAQSVERKVQGIFTPKGGDPITVYQPQEKLTVPELTQDQVSKIKDLKIGDKLPGFDLSPAKTSGASADLTPEAKLKAQNTLDYMMNKASDVGNKIAEPIKEYAKSMYEDPLTHFGPSAGIFKTIENKNPELYSKIKDSAFVKFEEAGYQGIIQGALRVYANWNPSVETFLDKELESIKNDGSDAEIVGNTIGNIIGTVGSFILGGEVATALKFGKVALPATFAVLGQTSLPADTPADARARNLIVDTVSGTLLEYIKPIANLQKLGMFEKGVEYTKQLTKSLTVLSGQVYLDARSVGASDEQAREMVKDSALIMLALHGFMIAGKAGDYAVRSKFKEGSAVFTPDQARGAVVGSNLEGTKLGNEIMKASLEAEAQGKNILIEMVAGKKSTVAKALNLQTPEGIAVTKIEYVDAPKQSKLGSDKITPADNIAVESVKTEPPKTGKTIQEGEVVSADAEIKRVAGNLIKNNPGLAQTEAEAMAKDVIAGRSSNQQQPKVQPVPDDVKKIIRTPTEFKTQTEEKAFTKINEDPMGVIQEYEKAFENEVSPDLALTQFEGYDGANAGDLSRASGTIKALVYDDLLKTQKGIKNNTVIFTAGGSGSGKTTGVQLREPLKEKYSVVVDTTFSNNSAPKDIKKALDSGYDVKIAFTFRDPVTAWEDGALKRIGEEGRVVSEGYFVQSHIDAQKNIVRAYDKYKDNPKVQFAFLENTPDGSFPEVSIDRVAEHLYNKGEIAQQITRATNKAYETGKITKKQYEAVIQDRSKLGAGRTEERSRGIEKEISQEKRSFKFVKPDEISAMGRVKTSAIDSVFNRIPDGTTSPDGYWVKREHSIYPTDKVTPEMLVNSLISLNPDGSLKDSFTYNKIAFVEDVSLAEVNSSVESNVQEPSAPGNTGGGVEHKSAYDPERLGEYTIAPSTAETLDEVMAEVQKLDLPPEVVKLTGKQGYRKPSITKADFKTLVNNSPELAENPVLVVDAEKNLVFNGVKVHFLIKPEALQISTANLKEGDRITIDTAKLKGPQQQMRISDKKGEILGFNPQGKPEYVRTYNLRDPDDAEYLARIFGESSVEEFKKGDYSRYQSRGGKEYAEKIAHANLVSETPQTPAEKLSGKVSDYTLQTDTVYHGTSPDNTQKILTEGFKPGAELPRDAFRGGGYDAMQKSISFSTDPRIASNFTGTGSRGVLFEVKINPKAKVVTIDGMNYAEDLNDYVDVLKDQGVDAVFLPDEKEVVVLNKDMIQEITDHTEFGVMSANKDLAKQFKKASEKPSGGNLGFNPKNLRNPESPEATRETNKITKQSEIAKFLSEKLGVPIRRGKFRHAGAIGVYKPGQKVVRIKSGGLNTIFHEVAHYLDDTIGFSKQINKTEREKLMQEYGYSYEGQAEKQRKEAFAEYMRFRMTGQTEKIADWAPEFDKLFSEKIKTMPDVDSVIKTATDDFARWNAQPATQKILSHLSIGAQNKDSLMSRATRSLHEVYTGVFDDLHPLAEFSKLANKNIGKIPAKQDPYILARNLRGWVGKADLFLNQGTFGKEFWSVGEDGKIKMNFTGKSYSEIMKPVEKMDALDDFRVYIVAERIVNDLAPRGIKTGISVDDAKTALAELKEKYPDFEQIAKERRQFKDALLEYAKENGVLGEEGLAKIKELNHFHVPFYRVMEESGAKFLGKTKIGGNIANPIKKIKGSEREIIDPLESDVKDVYAIINASDRNNIGVAMANIAQQNFELGRLFEEVVRPMKPVTVNAGEVIKQAVKGTDAEDLEIPEELADAIVTLFRPTYASGPNMLNVNLGDKQKVFEVDTDLFNTIQGLNIEDVGIIMKILSAPAKLLRAGATLSPDFSVRNPLRDQFTAFAYSKHGFIPGVDLVKGMFELFKKGDVYNLWKAGGGEHAMFVSLDRVKLQEGLDDVLSDPNLKDTVVDVVKHPIKVLQILSEFGEAGTRLGEMRNALASGVDPIESAFDSRNVTLDFSRIGTKTRAFNAVIAFMNANLQGTDAMIRNFKNRPFQTLWKVLLGLTLPSILLYLANRKDPRWKEIPQWQKNLFWIVMTKDHIWRIPKPFELGVLFGSVPERILEVIDTKDPEAFDELETSIISGFTPGYIPTFLLPIIENVSNYSFFLDRPIVNRGQENLPPGQQAGPYTTEVSKLLGEALNTSPAKIDNLVAGYTGGLGKYAQQGLDKILIGTGIVVDPKKPAKTFEEMNVIKAFLVREPIGTGSESVNRLYNKYASTNAQLTYVKQLVDDGKVEEARTYIKDHPDTLDAITYTSVVSTFSTFNQAIDLIRKSDLSPEEKRDRIQNIQRLQTNLAQKTLEEIKSKKQ